MPPWVGNGWTQITVASGCSGVANSPTRTSESCVANVMDSRVAGSTEFDEISVTLGHAAHECRDYSNMVCASDVGHRRPEQYLPTTQPRAVSPDGFLGHNLDNGTFYKPKNPLISERAIHRRGETRSTWNDRREAWTRSPPFGFCDPCGSSFHPCVFFIISTCGNPCRLYAQQILR